MSVAGLRPRFWNVPNSISVARLGLGAVMLVTLAWGWYALAAALFLAAALSDALDGHLARKLNQVTAIGRQLDPLVDKLLVAGALIYLVAIPGSGLSPWMVTVVVARELLIQWLRSLLEGRGEAFGAQWSGKLKTVLQCAAIVASLVALATPSAPPWMTITRDVLIWSAVGLTLYSGVAYLGGAWSKIQVDSR